LYWLDEVICRKQFEVDGDSFWVTRAWHRFAWSVQPYIRGFCFHIPLEVFLLLQWFPFFLSGRHNFNGCRACQTVRQWVVSQKSTSNTDTRFNDRRPGERPKTPFQPPAGFTQKPTSGPNGTEKADSQYNKIQP
jgi:hypothetical protein